MSNQRCGCATRHPSQSGISEAQMRIGCCHSPGLREDAFDDLPVHIQGQAVNPVRHAGTSTACGPGPNLVQNRCLQIGAPTLHPATTSPPISSLVPYAFPPGEAAARDPGSCMPSHGVRAPPRWGPVPSDYARIPWSKRLRCPPAFLVISGPAAVRRSVYPRPAPACCTPACTHGHPNCDRCWCRHRSIPQSAHRARPVRRATRHCQPIRSCYPAPDHTVWSVASDSFEISNSKPRRVLICTRGAAMRSP